MCNCKRWMGRAPRLRPVGKRGEAIDLQIARPTLWSPDNPFLYDLVVTLKDSEGRSVDRVKTYFGMRKNSLEKDDRGLLRLFLNNKPLFQMGILDQGWWSDGFYTAATDDALRY